MNISSEPEENHKSREEARDQTKLLSETLAGNILKQENGEKEGNVDPAGLLPSAAICYNTSTTAGLTKQQHEKLLKEQAGIHEVSPDSTTLIAGIETQKEVEQAHGDLHRDWTH